ADHHRGDGGGEARTEDPAGDAAGRRDGRHGLLSPRRRSTLRAAGPPKPRAGGPSLWHSGVCACRNPVLPVLVKYVALPAVGPPLILAFMRRLFLDPVFASKADTTARACDHPGCVAGGEFRAPKSRLELHNYYWFCLEHV